ncbi:MULTISPECIES: sensor histidine kinase [unclassified Aureimonas]|uniref:sensor histidine kinase n=1 Tax=unclassified Aureimonas TaxID=2615206 RepID=UPI0006F3EC1A|nr:MULTISPECIES: PAS domain-containing protein [unclassified Aureimonas]KQT52803.1 histidine kinase [Aureimonas sp. Leaf427]KQT80262.1 histidine kinase [Aureimonas sp. Leaf460]
MDVIDFESLFMVLPSPHMILDRDLRYVAANAAYEGAVNKSRSELVGGRLFDLFPNEGEGRRRLENSFRKVLETGDSDTIAFIPYEIPRPESEGGGFEQRYWTAIHTPLKAGDGSVAYILQNTVDVTDVVALQEAASLPFRMRTGSVELLQRAREAETAYQASLSESSHFRRLFQQAPGMIAVLSGPDHVFTFANDAYRRLVGDRALIGLPVREALPDIAGQGFYELLDGVYKLGQPHSAEGQKITLRQDGEPRPRETYLDFSYHPIRDVDGNIAGIFVQAADRTDHVLASNRQRLLVDELNHRVKNTLATVQSIARQSFKSVASEAARASFEARIQALSKAHDALSASHWEAVGLASLLGQELAPFGSHRIAVEGPGVDLVPRAAIALAMVFHELSANAASFGALARDSGSLAIRWSRQAEEDGGRLVLEWREEGGVSMATLPKPGFGTRLIERIVEGELGGQLRIAVDARGLVCRLDVPIHEIEMRAGPHAH